MEQAFDPPSPATAVDLGDEGLSSREVIDPYLERHWDGDRSVVVPAGRYRIRDLESLQRTVERDAWLVGDGNVVLEHGRAAGVGFNFEAAGDAHLRVQNLTLRGRTFGPDSKMRAWAPDGGLVELVNVNRPDGTESPHESTGCYVPPAHAGTLRFIDCHMEGFSDNGVYASSPGYDRGNDGPVEFYGGLYRNCNVSCVRVGSTNAKVIGAVVVNTETAPTADDDPTGYQRGIRVRGPGDDILIKDCDVYHADEPGVEKPIAIENGQTEFPADEGSTRIEETRIHNDTAQPVIAMREPDAAYDVTGEQLELTGDGNHDPHGGPYDAVRTGAEAAPPRTAKRWVYTGPYAVEEPAK